MLVAVMSTVSELAALPVQDPEEPVQLPVTLPVNEEEHKKLDIQLGMRGADYYEEGYGDTVMTLERKRKLLEEIPAYLLPTEEEMLEMEKNWKEPEDKTNLWVSNKPPYEKVSYPKMPTLSEINEQFKKIEEKHPPVLGAKKKKKR